MSKILKLPLADGSGYAKVDYSCLDLSPMFKVVEQKTTLSANSSQISINANVPSGYKFLCWLQAVTNGTIIASYVNPVNSKNAIIFFNATKTFDVNITTTFIAIKE